MEVPFGSVDIPRVSTIQEVADMFSRLKDGDLPGFIIRSAKPTPLYDVLSVHEASFREHGFEIEMWGSVHNGSSKKDAGLHIGNNPRPELPILSLAIAHHTLEGQGEVSLFDLAGKKQFNRDEAHNLFNKGLVDTEVLIPIRHKAIMSKRLVLVFREAGAFPVAHVFRTLSPKRYSSRAAIIPTGVSLTQLLV